MLRINKDLTNLMYINESVCKALTGMESAELSTHIDKTPDIMSTFDKFVDRCLMLNVDEFRIAINVTKDSCIYDYDKVVNDIPFKVITTWMDINQMAQIVSETYDNVDVIVRDVYDTGNFDKFVNTYVFAYSNGNIVAGMALAYENKRLEISRQVYKKMGIKTKG